MLTDLTPMEILLLLLPERNEIGMAVSHPIEASERSGGFGGKAQAQERAGVERQRGRVAIGADGARERAGRLRPLMARSRRVVPCGRDRALRDEKLGGHAAGRG